MLACPCRRTGPGWAALISGGESDDYGLVSACACSAGIAVCSAWPAWLVPRGRRAGGGRAMAEAGGQ